MDINPEGKTKVQKLAIEAIDRFELLIDAWERCKSKSIRRRLHRVLTAAHNRVKRRVDAMNEEQIKMQENINIAMKELGLDEISLQDEINKLIQENPNATNYISPG